MFALKAFWLQEYIKDRKKKRSAALTSAMLFL